MHTRPFRDKHGRGIRGPIFPSAIPRHASRSKAFDRAVLDAYSPIHARFQQELSQLDIAVDTVPRMRLGTDFSLIPDEVSADGSVPLGRVIPPAIDHLGRPTRARIVIFRMPVEQRCTGTTEKHELLTHVLTELVAYYLNMDPRDIDPNFQI